MGALVPVEAEYSEDLSTLCSDWSSSDFTYLLFVKMFKVANLGPHLKIFLKIFNPFWVIKIKINGIATFISHKIWYIVLNYFFKFSMLNYKTKTLNITTIKRRDSFLIFLKVFLWPIIIKTLNIRTIRRIYFFWYF